TGQVLTNVTLPGLLNPKLNSGSSDFDVRQTFHGAVFAQLPFPRSGPGVSALQHWTVSSIFFARTALPSDLFTLSVSNIAYIRPDLVADKPLYLYGSGYPGGKRFNPAAFTAPSDGVPEGTLGRNVMRGFPAWQADIALHRDFHLKEK